MHSTDVSLRRRSDAFLNALKAGRWSVKSACLCVTSQNAAEHVSQLLAASKITSVKKFSAMLRTYIALNHRANVGHVHQF
jgi:hypothetical protein